MLVYGINIEYFIFSCIMVFLLIIGIINEIVRFLLRINSIRIYEVSDAYTIEGTENHTLENSRSTIQVVYGTV
jgi:hypothetical protein